MEKMRSEYEKGMLQRAQLLMGASTIDILGKQRVIIFGVGGVGSWCAEVLVRTGIRHLTIVDSDHIALSNCNRQLMATSKTIGQVKVEALRERLLELNPDADITALELIYDEETVQSFHLEEYDYVIDAIDSLRDKAHLILTVTNIPNGPTLFSSMGAALRIDPTKVTTAEFWKVKGDPLARALRDKFKRAKTFPGHKFMCVYSEEPPLKNLGEQDETDLSPEAFHKVQTNGSLAHITGIFGFMLAGLVIKNNRPPSPL